MSTLSRNKLQTFIQSLNGKFFTVQFTKKDGTLRYMTARTGVKKGVNGRGTYSHTRDVTRSNLTVWDTAKLAFRAVPLDRTHSIKANGQTFVIV